MDRVELRFAKPVCRDPLPPVPRLIVGSVLDVQFECYSARLVPDGHDCGAAGQMTESKDSKRILLLARYAFPYDQYVQCLRLHAT